MNSIQPRFGTLSVPLNYDLGALPGNRGEAFRNRLTPGYYEQQFASTEPVRKLLNGTLAGLQLKDGTAKTGQTALEAASTPLNNYFQVMEAFLEGLSEQNIVFTLHSNLGQQAGRGQPVLELQPVYQEFTKTYARFLLALQEQLKVAPLGEVLGFLYKMEKSQQDFSPLVHLDFQNSFTRAMNIKLPPNLKSIVQQLKDRGDVGI